MITLPEKRKVCVSIPIRNQENDLRTDLENILVNIQTALTKGADMIECRFDYMTEFEEFDAFLEVIAKYKASCVYTLRPVSQGGNFVDDNDDVDHIQRLKLLKKLIDQEPQFVDIEYDTISKNDDLADYAELSKTKILVSWHDFERTPHHTELINLVNQMRIYSPYLKVITMAHSFDDALEIFELYQNLDTNTNLVSFAMGESGTITRVLGSIIGDTPFTYASLDVPIAPGQLSISQMQRFYAVLRKRLV